MKKLIGNLVEYKFVFNQNVKHDEYQYQKIFRAIYGYKQVVKKKNKSYIYYRPGILTFYPFLKDSKNKVVIPDVALDDMIYFFKTGKNPGHNWTIKGKWSVEYKITKKNLDEKDILSAVNSFFNEKRFFIKDLNEFFSLKELLSRKMFTIFFEKEFKEKIEKTFEDEWILFFLRKNPRYKTII